MTTAPRTWPQVLFALLLATVLAAVLEGCATPRKPIPPDGNYWHGRLALKVESNPPESMSASFELSGTAEAGELVLSSPIGTTVAVLNWKPGEVLLQAEGRERHFDTLEQLAQEATGTAFPVAQLFGWLKRGNQLQAAAAKPAGAASSPATPPATQSTMGGWQADLSQLADGKLTAKRLSGGPPAELRLVLEK